MPNVFVLALNPTHMEPPLAGRSFFSTREAAQAWLDSMREHASREWKNVEVIELDLHWSEVYADDTHSKVDQ